MFSKMQKILDQYQAKLTGPEKFYAKTDKVSFICECGTETTKAHRDITRAGAYCKPCQKAQKSKKISDARSIKDVITDETAQRKCSECKHVRDVSLYRHAQSNNIETSLCEICRQKKQKRDRKYREQRLKAEVTDDKKQKCSVCLHIRDKKMFKDKNKSCVGCNKHSRSSYAKMKNVAEIMNDSKGDTKMCVRCWKIDNTDRFITDTGHSGVVCIECTDAIHATKNDFRQIYLDYKKSRGPCVDCGESDIRVLDFDHINRDLKVLCVSLCRSIEQLKLEADKCEMRCVICHTRRTKKQLNYGSQADKSRREKRDHVNQIKSNSSGCEECGWFDDELLEALEFDHIDTNAKNANISSMVAESSFSVEDIDYEISICRLVCGKCHRLHSLTQRMEHWADIRAEIN